MKIQFIGVQGSGKSTQAKQLATTLNFPFYGLSDLLRKAIAEEDLYVIMRYTLDDITQGNLAGDDVIEYLIDSIEEDDYVMEGYLRTPEQAQLWADRKSPEDMCIELTIDEATAVTRMQDRKRVDDTESAIKKRLEKFYANMVGIRKNILNSNYYLIESYKTPDEVNADIIERVKLNEQI
jgi:adenylate kinase family enzyme